jgi:glucose-1-phosphate thymidylyltransferase
MKAIIPVAGIGSRLRPHTHTQPKSLVPVAGNTILGHIIDRLKAAGLTEYVFIIGYLGEKIEQYVREHYPELQSTFVVQSPREGLGHALYMARETFRHDTDGVLILLGDTIVDIDLPALLAQPGTILAVKEVKTPSLFGIVETDAEGRVNRVVEKPRIPKSNYALVGLYKIANAEKLAESLEWLINTDQRTHEEFQLTDALMHLIEEGEVMRPAAKRPCSKPTPACSTSPSFTRPSTTPILPIPSSFRPSASGRAVASRTPLLAPTWPLVKALLSAAPS